MISKRHKRSRTVFFLQVLGFCAWVNTASAAELKILSDRPGELKARLDASDLVITSSSEGSFHYNCEGCQSPPQEGSPDLPYFSFSIITTADEPVVSLRPLKEKRFVFDQPPASVPSYLPDGTPVFKKNPALYSASGFKALVGPAKSLRGVPIRNVMVPLSAWQASEKALITAGEIEIVISFPNTYDRPEPLSLPGVFTQSLANPQGGRYNFIRKPVPALKRAVQQANIDLNNPVVKITFGDKDVASLSEDGVYEVSYQLIEKSYSGTGLSGSMVSGFSPASLRMYTGPQEIWPDSVSHVVSGPSLREIPIEVIDKNNNGTFDEGDAVRFYAHGTSYWKALAEGAVPDTIPFHYAFQTNPFSFSHCYYLEFSAGQSDTSRLKTLTQPAQPSGGPLQSGQNYLRAEQESGSGICHGTDLDDQLGRDWYWHLPSEEICKVYNAVRTFTGGQIQLPGGRLPGYTAASPVFFSFNMVGRSTTIKKNSFDLIFPSGNAEYLPDINIRDHDFYRFTGTVSEDNFSFQRVVWRGSSSQFGLDGYSVAYTRPLRYEGSPLWIYPGRFDEPAAYQVDPGAGRLENLRCLKVENGIAIGELTLSSGGIFSDQAARGGNVRYLVYAASNIMAVTAGQLSAERLSSRPGVMKNLRTGDKSSPEYLIIAPDIFLDAAVQLKQFRSDRQNRVRSFRTELVRVEDIYREFSGGRMSPIAIREFIRWAYHGWRSRGAPDTSLKYVLLFGDGQYDYRSIKADPAISSNYIPPYEIDDFCTDDFFGYLDMGDVVKISGELDVAVGRVPVSSSEEAQGFIDKVRSFEDPSQAEAWRNNFLQAADDDFQRKPDGSDYDGIPHLAAGEKVADIVYNEERGKNILKIYLQTYEHNYAFSKPEAAQDLLNQLNLGVLMVNYFGHGDYHVWADEGLLVLDKAMPKLANAGRYSVITSFSCTVGRFEQVTAVGMSEAFVSIPGKGAIAAVSATRTSYAGQNENLANKFYSYIFRLNSEGSPQTIGDALRRAKLETSSTSTGQTNNEKYGLFGEPVTFIRKPNLGIEVTDYPDTLKALDCGSIRGNISGGTGTGSVHIKIFGSSRLRLIPPRSSDAKPLQFIEPGELIFASTVPYKDFSFTMNYFLREKLPFGDSNAVIQVFAWDGRKEQEGSLLIQRLAVMGEARTCNVNDTEGPRIIISGCERAQTSGVDFSGQVRVNAPYCMEVTVIDSLGGVLVSNKPDEGTTITIKRVADEVLKDYEYQSQPQLGEDGFLKKTFKWNISSEMVPGNYLLKVRAQDGFGNMSVRDLNVEIADESVLSIYRVFNVPNPVRDKGTCFYFGEIAEQGSGEFYEAEATLSAQIKIYNQSGLLIKRLNDVQPRLDMGQTEEKSCKERNAWWNGRDKWGNRMANGVYFYEVKVTRESTGEQGGRVTRSDSKMKPLIISR